MAHVDPLFERDSPCAAGDLRKQRLKIRRRNVQRAAPGPSIMHHAVAASKIEKTVAPGLKFFSLSYRIHANLPLQSGVPSEYRRFHAFRMPKVYLIRTA